MARFPTQPSDPEEVPIRDYGPVDLHHDRRRVAVLVLEPPSEIEQDDGEILIDDHAGTQPVDQERTILITRQDALDLALAVTVTRVPLPHCPRHGRRVVAERLKNHRPFEPPLSIALLRLLLRGDLLGGQRDGLWQVIFRKIISTTTTFGHWSMK